MANTPAAVVVSPLCFKFTCLDSNQALLPPTHVSDISLIHIAPKGNAQENSIYKILGFLKSKENPFEEFVLETDETLSD